MEGKGEETRRKIFVGGGVAVWIIPQDIVLHPGVTHDEAAGRGPSHPIRRHSRMSHTSGRLDQKLVSLDNTR